MAAKGPNPSLVDVCRRILPVEEQMDKSIKGDNFTETFVSLVEDDNEMMEIASLFECTRDEQSLLSKSGKPSLNYLEIEEGVKELDWGAILTHEKCALDELRVTIESPSALADLVKALCNNTSLSLLDLEYYHLDDDLQDEELDHLNHMLRNKISKNSVESSLSLNEMFFEALMPLQHVILRGITPVKPSSSKLFDDMNHATICSWQHLTIEECHLTRENIKWLPACIINLEEIVIRNCELSGETIQVLSEAYLSVSASRPQITSRRLKRERHRKNSLRVLNLSNNDWLVSPNYENSNTEKASHSIFPDDEECSINHDVDYGERITFPQQSCLGFLASWLDSLSNLVELDLSNNPQLFRVGMENDNRGMVDLCGTVNQSLKRLSLRNCHLLPNDLHQIVNTFCWLEALDLSENSAIISKISLLSQLEYLTEIVLENMIEHKSNETFEFERRLSEEEFDWKTGADGLVDLLLELLNGENGIIPDKYSRTRRIGRHRQKPLERLNLSGNVINKKILKILSSFNSLKVLVLMGCQINGDGIIELLSDTNNCTPRYSSLRELYLASNVIGDIGILSLAQNMKDGRLPFLKILNLESNVISVEAFRVFIEDSLVHSNRLQFVQVSDHGAITYNQRERWDKLVQKMEHILLLNQAGRFTLFVDGNCNVDSEEKRETYDYNNCNEKNADFCQNKISANSWPLILENADSIYGTDALFYFLHKRPDLFFSSQKPQLPSTRNPTLLKPFFLKATSPNGVEDIASFLL